MARTSASHPLQIAYVSAGEGLGRVGLTLCPGKKQPHALTGAWDRSLDADMAAIAGWGAAVMVTLVEPHELKSLGVEALGEVAMREHLDWVHLPIVDGGVPDARFEQGWRAWGGGLRSRLRAGFDILVHCKGGQGRAGTIAARLLIDCGWQPEAALAAVRYAREGAVENMMQERYVLGLRPLPEQQPAMSEEAITDRAVGALLGLAVGDAIGTTLEFVRRDSKPPVTDMVGGGPFDLKPGEWTDDTAMALALADSLAAHPELDETDLMNRFVAWFRTGAYSCTGRCFDIGVTTREALAGFEKTGDPLAGSTDPMSAGNGSLMRLAPVAIRHWRDREVLSDIADRQSCTTHAATEAVHACMGYANLIANAIAGMSRDEVLMPLIVPSFTLKVKAVMDGSWRGKRRDQINSSGYVVHSLEAALWCIGRTIDFRSAVLLAANLGDDADTTAAITSQLAGAIYGASGIPAKWRERVARGQEIVDIATTLTNQACSHGLG